MGVLRPGSQTLVLARAGGVTDHIQCPQPAGGVAGKQAQAGWAVAGALLGAEVGEPGEEALDGDEVSVVRRDGVEKGHRIGREVTMDRLPLPG